MGAEARYHAKREAGISPVRRDGSVTSAETDRQAGAAEEFAARILGAEYNDAVYSTHGDGGSDFTVEGYTFEVVWLGFRAGTHEPRMYGNLIVNPDEPQRHADIYAVVSGCVEMGFKLVGWASHATLVSRPLRDFGFGPKYALSTSRLRPFKRVGGR